MAKPGNMPFLWPWLQRGRECQNELMREVRELRLFVSPLKSVAQSRKNPRAYHCPVCHDRKAFGGRREITLSNREAVKG
jgi:predicted SprT family Zn-dependent metalloprotease